MRTVAKGQLAECTDNTIRAHWQGSSSIELLPVEILLEIFLATLDAVYETSPTRLRAPQLDEARRSLALVCRWWADICMRNSSFWSYITFSHHVIPAMQTRIDWVQKCISRSAGRRITLVLSHPSESRYYYPMVQERNLKGYRDSLLDVLVMDATANRISRLSLGVLPCYYICQVLSVLASAGTQLNDIHLDSLGYFAQVSEYETLDCFGSLASLNHLHVGAARIDTPAIIHILSGYPLSTLQSITLECKFGNGVDKHDFRPDEQELSWNTKYEAMVFPQLRSLELIQSDLSPYIFDAPQLEHLVWIPHSMVGAPKRRAVDGHAFTVRIRNVYGCQFPNLSSLVVCSSYDTCSFVEDVSALVRHHPSVNDLRLVGRAGASSILRYSYEVDSLPNLDCPEQGFHPFRPPKVPPHIPFYAPRQLKPMLLPSSLRRVVIETTSTNNSSTSFQSGFIEAWEDDLMNVILKMLSLSDLSLTWIRGFRQRAYTSDDLRVLNGTWSPVTSLPTSFHESGKINLQDQFPGRFTLAKRRDYVHGVPNQ